MAQERVNEWISLLNPIVQTVIVHQMDIDEVHLLGVTSTGDSVGTFTTTAQDLLDYGEKRITRAEFLNRAKYFLLIPTLPAPTPMPLPTVTRAATGSIGTRNNPVSQGVPYRFPGLGSLTVSSQWSRGQTGLAIVYLTFVCERPSSQKCDVLNFMLAVVGGSGNVYEQEFDSSVPQPGFWDFMNNEVYGGGTLSGYAGFKITQSESNLQLRVGIFLEDDEVFFDIS